MSKLSVRATAIAAYDFTFKNYLRLLGITWAPALIMIVIMLWQFVPFVGDMQQGVLNHDQAAIFAGMRHVLLFEAATMLLLTIIAVGITRLALGLSTGWRFFYFGVGADFGRLLLAYFIMGLILFGIIILISIPLGITVGIVAAKMAGPNPTPVEISLATQNLMPVLLVCIYAIMIFIFLRLAFLLPSIVVNERRIGLGRNWKLTRGNFWRVVGLTIAILIPILVLTVVQFSALAIIGGQSWNFFSSFNSQATQMVWSQKVMNLYLTYWYIYIPVGIALGPIFNGPIFGASAFAYRALAAEPRPEIPAA